MGPCYVQSPEAVALSHSWLFIADTSKFLELLEFGPSLLWVTSVASVSLCDPFLWRPFLGVIPRSGIQAVKSPSSQGRVHVTSHSYPRTPHRALAGCCRDPELCQLSLPNCLLTVKMSKGKGLGRMGDFVQI